MDPILIILLALIVVLVIVIAVASYNHVNKSSFNPKFIQLSDGSLIMEFYNFGGLQTARTKRFYEQYKPGMTVTHAGK